MADPALYGHIVDVLLAEHDKSEPPSPPGRADREEAGGYLGYLLPGAPVRRNLDSSSSLIWPILTAAMTFSPKFASLSALAAGC